MTYILEKAPIQVQIKAVYLLSNLIGHPIPMIKSPLAIVEANRYKFLQGEPPILYNFSEWKYYLHYSLFFTVGRS